MRLLLAGRDDRSSYLRSAAAAAAMAVPLQLVFAQLTLTLTGCLLVIGRLTRWRPRWLLVPAAAGCAWVLAIGPKAAAAGYLTAADLAVRQLTGPGAATSLPANLGRWRDWLPVQFPLALVVAAAEASVALVTGLIGGTRPYRAGALVTVRRALLVASIRRGELATSDGGRIGVVETTGRAAAIGWQEAERGVLCTGRERHAVTATGLDLALAAIQHRKSVIIVDLAGGSDSAIGSACVAVGAPLLRAGGSAKISLPEALAGRFVVMFRAAPAAVAWLAATLDNRSQTGVPEDCLVWIDGCEAVEPSRLRDLLAAADRCHGAAVVLGTASGRAAAGLAGRVNVTVLAGPAPEGLGGSPLPDGLPDYGRDEERTLFVRDPRRLVRCVTAR